MEESIHVRTTSRHQVPTHISVAFSDYRGLKKQIAVIRKARLGQQPPEPPLEESITDVQVEAPGLSRLSNRSQSQPDLVQPGVEDNFPRLPSDAARGSSISRRDPDSASGAQAKLTLFQTTLRSPTSNASPGSPSPSRGENFDSTSTELVRTGPGRSLARSMSALRKRRNTQTSHGGEHRFVS
jgi:hypothetical protein